ncbi:hypothetical protein FOMPIDRAFT_1135638, partial [Fomitopsis schrenkii]
MHAQDLERDRKDGISFPPKPPSKELLSQIIHGFAREVDPLVHSESGCAVCGMLT